MLPGEGKQTPPYVHQVSISAPWHLGGSLLGGLVFGSHLLEKRGEVLMGGNQDGWDQDSAKYMTPTVICPILPKVPDSYSGNCGAKNRVFG